MENFWHRDSQSYPEAKVLPPRDNRAWRWQWSHKDESAKVKRDRLGKYFQKGWEIFSGKCLTPSQLLICSSFSRENGHLLLICSSPFAPASFAKLGKIATHQGWEIFSKNWVALKNLGFSMSFELTLCTTATAEPALTRVNILQLILSRMLTTLCNCLYTGH